MIFNKGRTKGMDDIFGGPSDVGMALGMGPGVIGMSGVMFIMINVMIVILPLTLIPPDGHGNGYSGQGGRGGGASSFNGAGYESAGRPSFEEKFRETNSNYNNSNQRERGEDFKKRDNFESKFAARPDFGDRFTANRNKTHPSNRGGGDGRGEREGLRRSPGYEERGARNGFGSGEREAPPRFSGGGRMGDRDRDQPLRPQAMLLKPKTPFSLPKSAMAKLDSINPLPSSGVRGDKVMMSSNEPAVIIQKPGAKKAADKKNQGPTRDEVFGKVDAILKKLAENDSTNEAFTSWKEIGIPDKMVNNALIHLFKQVIKLDEEAKRVLCYQVVEQLFASELVTAVQVKESLARLVDRQEESTTLTTAELAAWTVASDKLKLGEVAEMTEGGATHPLFLCVLQALAVKDESATLEKFQACGVKLTDQLPLALRTEEQLGDQLEQRQLSFLVPLLAIKADMGRQLEEAEVKPAAFLAWVTEHVPLDQQKEPGFITALVGAVVKHISEATTLVGEGSQDKDVTDKEKEMILAFKPVLAPFLTSVELQLAAVYSLQVFCFSRTFPKGLLLRWFVSLYEADVVDEQVFLKWKEDVNDSYPGKGKALFQVGLISLEYLCSELFSISGISSPCVLCR